MRSFTRVIAAVLTMALGIGAATAIFSLVRPTLLHPFTFPRAGELVMIDERDPQGAANPVSFPDFRDWSSQRNALPQMGAFDIGFFELTGVDNPEEIPGALITPNLFRLLGVAPALGRDFRDGEERSVILSDAAWRKRFGADPNILGRNIALDFARTKEIERYTVVGVMPSNFWMYYGNFEVFVPLGTRLHSRGSKSSRIDCDRTPRSRRQRGAGASGTERDHDRAGLERARSRLGTIGNATRPRGVIDSERLGGIAPADRIGERCRAAAGARASAAARDRDSCRAGCEPDAIDAAVAGRISARGHRGGNDRRAACMVGRERHDGGVAGGYRTDSAAAGSGSRGRRPVGDGVRRACGVRLVHGRRTGSSVASKIGGFNDGDERHRLA